MINISEQKKAARKIAFAARKTAFSQKLDKAANGHLRQLMARLDGAEIIAAYMPIRTEISPIETMEWLVEQGKTICVPVVQGPEKPLLFKEWTPSTNMIEGAFGAAIPETASQVVPDVVITPLVGFDDQGHRLGYGGGFYDRSFEKIGAKKKCLAVGFAYSAQRLESVPTELTDHKLDWMVTEDGVKGI